MNNFKDFQNFINSTDMAQELGLIYNLLMAKNKTEISVIQGLYDMYISQEWNTLNTLYNEAKQEFSYA